MKEAKVVRIVSPNEIVANLGVTDGVDESTSFLVYALGDEITDPDSGESLGNLEIVRGRGTTKHVQARMTTIRSAERRKVIRDRVRPIPQDTVDRMMSPFPKTETVTDVVEEPAPFEGVRVGDFVRPL